MIYTISIPRGNRTEHQNVIKFYDSHIQYVINSREKFSLYLTITEFTVVNCIIKFIFIIYSLTLFAVKNRF